MTNIGMKETRRNHPQLLACADTPNMELIFSKKQKIVKPLKTDQDIGNNNGNQDGIHAAVIFRKSRNTSAAFVKVNSQNSLLTVYL